MMDQVLAQNSSAGNTAPIDSKLADNNEHTDTPLLPHKAVDVSLPPAGLVLSDSTNIIPADELSQRREALRLFSSEQSMASYAGRSMTAISTSAAVIAPNPSLTPINYQVSITNELTPFSSTISSLSPLCRICQCPAEPGNGLITPCRCDGSLKHIHTTCLLKWIDVSNRRLRRVGKAAFCELCGYIYRRHKYVKYRDWKWPKIAVRDRVLHLIFAISLVVMIGCAIATVLCFVTDDQQYRRTPRRNPQLTKEEIITICCGITFFISFFVSMSAEIKAKKTIHQILRKCLRYNTVWFIENYCPANDPKYKRPVIEREAKS